VAEVVGIDRRGERPQIRREKIVASEGAAEPLRLEQEALVAARRGEASNGVSGTQGRRALAAARRVLEALDAHAARVDAARQQKGTRDSRVGDG
jgi:hypothetical protein